MTNTAAPATELHLVIAVVRAGDRLYYTAVSAPVDWTDAQAQWNRLSDHTRETISFADLRSGMRRTHVERYMVRSASDPRFAGLVSRPYKGVNGQTEAAKAWAAEHGYEGRKGGWIYRPNGMPQCQGWQSLGVLCARVGRIRQGADGAWYVTDLPMVESL